MAKIATQLMTYDLTGTRPDVTKSHEKEHPHYGVKEAVLPFNMFPEVDPLLGHEMRSTGEVLRPGRHLRRGVFQVSGGDAEPAAAAWHRAHEQGDDDKGDLVEVGRLFAEAGFEIAATEGTCKMLQDAGIAARKVLKVQEGRPNLVDLILNNEVELVLNTPSLSTE